MWCKISCSIYILRPILSFLLFDILKSMILYCIPCQRPLRGLNGKKYQRMRKSSFSQQWLTESNGLSVVWIALGREPSDSCLKGHPIRTSLILACQSRTQTSHTENLSTVERGSEVSQKSSSESSQEASVEHHRCSGTDAITNEYLEGQQHFTWISPTGAAFWFLLETLKKVAKTKSKNMFERHLGNISQRSTI